MTITEMDLRRAEEIFLEQARAHFPPSVEFMESNASLWVDPYDEEWVRVELVYSAPGQALDGNLMNSLHRRTDEPIRAAGVTDLTMVHYVDINDPTRRLHSEGTPTP